MLLYSVIVIAIVNQSKSAETASGCSYYTYKCKSKVKGNLKSQYFYLHLNETSIIFYILLYALYMLSASYKHGHFHHKEISIKSLLE